MVANESNVESHKGSFTDWTSFDYLFKDFLGDLLLKITIYSVTDQLSIRNITQSRESVLRLT